MGQASHHPALRPRLPKNTKNTKNTNTRLAQTRVHATAGATTAGQATNPAMEARP